MLFSERKELSDKYEKWIEENKAIKDCPFSVVTYLDMFGYLNPPKRKEEKIVKYENRLTKDDIKQALNAPSSINEVIDEYFKAVEQGMNQYIYKKSVAENKSPSQVYDELMKDYAEISWDDFLKKLKGEDNDKRDS